MIIGIEGVSCVGKSTLAAGLAARLGTATVIPCYFHSVAEPSALPPLVAPTGEQQLAGLEALLRVEHARRAAALAAESTGQIVILDRTADTLLAHTLAVDALMGFGIAGTARSLVERAGVAIPALTLLVTAPFAARQARAARRVGMPALLYAQAFTTRFLDHFERPLTARCVRVDGSGPPSTLVEQAREILNEHPAASLLTQRNSA